MIYVLNIKGMKISGLMTGYDIARDLKSNLIL